MTTPSATMTVKELERRIVAAHGPYIKINLQHPDGAEGLWAKIETEEDAERYSSNHTGAQIQILLLNCALVAGPSWGMRFRVELRGHARPYIALSEFIRQAKAQIDTYPPPKAFKRWR